MPKKILPSPLFRFLNLKKGFTLIELLVVVALIGILSTVILANYNSFGSRQEVRNTAENFKSELRKYQTYAISGQKDPDQTGSCTGDLDSYSVHVSANEYRVRINCDISSDVAVITLPVSVSASPSCNPVATFQPLDRGTLVCGGSSANVEFVGADGTIYTVVVNESGEILVNQPTP